MIYLYDTTLRDGSQGEGVSFTVQDKVRIARRLDELGFHYVEGGWPGSNPKDIAFFEAVRDVRFENTRICAFAAYATPKLAVEVIKAGAMDYLAKPFAPEELLHAVERCAERHRLLQENATLRARAVETYRLEQIIGESPKVRELRHLIETVAPTNATVLILGESGTGKELVAGSSLRFPGASSS